MLYPLYSGLTTLTKSPPLIPVSQRTTNIQPNGPSAIPLTGSSGCVAPPVASQNTQSDGLATQNKLESPPDFRLEHGCRHWKDCHGKCGNCAYNHILVPYGKEVCVTLSQISESDRLRNICRNDQPWVDKRCGADACGFEHFWGYVGIRIERQNKKKQAAEQAAKKYAEKHSSTTQKQAVEITLPTEPPVDQKQVAKPPAVESTPAAKTQKQVAKPPAVESTPAAKTQKQVAKPPAVESTPAAKKQKQGAKPPVFTYDDARDIAEDCLITECLSQHHNLDTVNHQLETLEGYTWKQMLTFSGDSIDVAAGAKSWSFSRARFFGSSDFQNKLRGKIKASIPGAYIRINVTQQDGANVFSITGEKLRCKT
jgi:hypothetical protein